MNWTRSMLLVAALLATAFLSSTAKADELYARIQGTVTDESGAVVPDATVTATNIGTGVAKDVTSGSDGTYSFLQLAIGDYEVKAEKSGFQVYTTSRIHLDVNQVYTLGIVMAVGTVNQTVTVEANPIEVESTSPQLGTVISAQQIVDLPLIGRNWVQLQALQPGVVSGSDRFGVGSGGTDFATNGGQSQFNVFLVDGTDTNDLVLNTTTFIASEDAVAEFRMVTSTLNPEYARTSGAVVNALIKSGTNSFHGDVFDFYRDTFLNAVNYFATHPQPFHQNVFGGTLGAPAIKNHTFFFFSYQGTRASQPQTSNGVSNGVETTHVFLPTQLSGTGTFTNIATSTKVSPFPLVGDNGTTYPAGTKYSTIFASGTVPTADINTLSKSLITKYVPSPSVAGTNTYAFNATRAVTDDQYIARIDENITPHDTLWGTWIQEKLANNVPVPFFGATLPGFGETDGEHFKFLTLSYTHIFNDHMVNELRGGYNRFNYAAVFPQTPVLPSTAGFSITPQDAAGAGLPVISVSGLFSLGFSQDGPQPRIDQVYEAVDNFSLIEGQHTLKFGFDMRRWETFNPFLSVNDGYYQFKTSGIYSTGNAGADFLLGIPTSYNQGSGSLEDSRARQYYSYAQDEYKARHNLTLTYGLGWTIDTPAVNQAFKGHGQVAFRPGQQSIVFPNAPVGVVYSGDPGVHAAGSTMPWRQWGPRFGFAYTPSWGGWLTGGPGKTSIRGGYGIFYDRSETEQADQVVGMPPFAIATAYGGNPVVGIAPSFANPFKDIATGATQPSPYPFAGPSSTVQFTQANGYLPVFGFCCSVLAPTYRDPMAENYNLTLERQLTGTTIMSLGYVGSVAHHLTIGLPQNVSPGLDSTGTPTFPYDPDTYGSIDTIFSGANSNYNSFQASVKQNVFHGLNFLASYTYAHSLDESSGFENSSFGGFGGESGGFGGAIRSTNPYCFPKCDYGTSIFDATNRLVVAYGYRLPGIGNGNWMLSRLTQGWTITGITTFQSGFPLDVADLSLPSGGCLAAASDFSCWDVPNQVAPVKYRNPRTLTGGSHFWFDPSSFTQVACAPSCNGTATPPPGGYVSPASVLAYGNAPRDPMRGPGINNWDFVLYKDTAINERIRMQLRLEAYNLFNHTQFDPNGVTGDVSSGAFGTITAARNPRQLQLAAKFIF